MDLAMVNFLTFQIKVSFIVKGNACHLILKFVIVGYVY